MRNLLTTIAAVFAFLATSEKGDTGERTECRVVDHLALVGYNDWNIVSLTAKEDKKECRFSVDGASAGSPPQEKLDAAVNAMVGNSRGRSPLLDQPEIDVVSLATLLVAAGPDTDAREMAGLLSSFSEPLAKCRDAVFEGNTIPLSFPGQFPVTCGLYAPRGSGQLFEIGPFRSTVQGELSRFRFVVVTRRENLWNLVSIPLR